MSITLRTQQPPLTPFQQVWKRLVAHKPALVGLCIILLCLGLTFLGYLVMPDQTPYANDGAVQLAKQPPGFTVQLLKLRKNMDVRQVSWIERMLFGQESNYQLVPIEEYRIEHLTIRTKLFRSGREENFSLIEATLPLHPEKVLDSATKLPYRLLGNQIQYLDRQGLVHVISQANLVNLFQKQNIEIRTYRLGTDGAGRDMLSRLLFGIRISLGIGCMAVLISLLLGTTLGALAGYFGGKPDGFITWLMTVVWSVPNIMLVIAISMAMGSRSVWVAFIAVGLTMWVDVARVVRGQMMGLKEKLYVEAARSVGMSNRNIILRHILPNMLGPLLVIIASNFATAILTEAGLSFLGLGVQPPMPSWGAMVQEGFYALGSRGSLHLVLFPSLCISTLVMAFNLLGNGLRDAFDPNTFLK